jgi:P27 family predicted phage terminase small subunit
MRRDRIDEQERVMPGGRPRGAIVSELKLPPTVRATRSGAKTTETMHSKLAKTRPEKPANMPAVLDALWESTVEALDEAGLITPVDGPTLELALRHYLAAVAASDDLLQSGSTLHDDKNERDMKNPASQVFRDHSTAFLEFAKQLGLSFVSRARVTMSKGESDDGNPFAVGQ